MKRVIKWNALTWSITARLLPATTTINFLSTWLRTLASSRELLSMDLGTKESPARCKMPENMSSIWSWSLKLCAKSPPCVVRKVHNLIPKQKNHFMKQDGALVVHDKTTTKILNRNVLRIIPPFSPRNRSIKDLP